MSSLRVVFMGTPDFAATILNRIIASGHEVIAVVTQPDKEKGRGKALSTSPVKELALEHQLPVYQPAKVREEGFIQTIRSLDPQVMIVAAFGQILPKALLDISPYGCINVHGSLLPKYRGAAPIQYSIIDGEKETGITIMYMDAGIDTGDMILQGKTEISEEETGGSLHDKLALLGADLLMEALNQIQEGKIKRIPQDHEKATYVKVLNKEMGKIDFEKSAVQIERLIRGLNPWPSAYTSLDGKMLKIWEARAEEADTDARPGEIIEVRKDAIVTATGNGLLVIKQLQQEGKKRMAADAFLRGYPVVAGTILGI